MTCLSGVELGFEHTCFDYKDAAASFCETSDFSFFYNRIKNRDYTQPTKAMHLLGGVAGSQLVITVYLLGNKQTKLLVKWRKNPY